MVQNKSTGLKIIYSIQNATKCFGLLHFLQATHNHASIAQLLHASHLFVTFCTEWLMFKYLGPAVSGKLKTEKCRRELLKQIEAPRL